MNIDEFVIHLRQKCDALISLNKEVDVLVKSVFTIIQMDQQNLLLKTKKDEIIKLQLLLDEILSKFREIGWTINLDTLRGVEVLK